MSIIVATRYGNTFFGQISCLVDGNFKNLLAPESSIFTNHKSEPFSVIRRQFFSWLPSILYAVFRFDVELYSNPGSKGVKLTKEFLKNLLKNDWQIPKKSTRKLLFFCASSSIFSSGTGTGTGPAPVLFQFFFFFLRSGSYMRI